MDNWLAGDERAAAQEGLETFVETGWVNYHDGVGVDGGLYWKFGLV